VLVEPLPQVHSVMALRERAVEAGLGPL